jgi:hypothetical protein
MKQGGATMTTRYMVGTRVGNKSSAVTIVADDALIAALMVKQQNPAATITYVRKQKVRGDRRHPHSVVSDGLSSARSRGSR